MQAAPAAAARCRWVVLPGFGNAQDDYDGFVEALGRRGVEADVVPITRSDWLRVATGAVDFFSNSATPFKPGYGWYLERVRDTVRSAYDRDAGARRIVLAGHSAGGWLGRAALGGQIWSTESLLLRPQVGGAGSEVKSIQSEDLVSCLVTLGTPHTCDPSMDMTRGALTYTEQQFPGAFLQERGVGYISVAGSGLVGEADAPRKDPRRFAYGSYKAVCGDGNQTGDGCVPLSCCHLVGAEQITLPGVLHSVNTPSYWYGAEEVIDAWLPAVDRAVAARAAAKAKGRAWPLLWPRV